MKTVVVSGVIANKLHNGGAAWTRLSWANGLQKLGYRVVFVEQIASANCTDFGGKPCNFSESANLAHFKSVTKTHGLSGAASLILDDGNEVYGMSITELQAAADDAGFLLNISGHLTLDSILNRFRRRVYLDLDPGYTQYWHEQGHAIGLDRHDVFFSVGQNIRLPGCSIPTAGRNWLPARQPVVLEDWPAQPSQGCKRLTTIASWRGPFGPIEIGGVRLGPKAQEFRKFVSVPRDLAETTVVDMEIALDIHPADERDLQNMKANGWSVVDPRAVAGTPEKFRNYVQQSSGEFSVAQGMYVQTHSGWFSDRTVRYLASARPVIVQDTGLSAHFPIGSGLLTFNDPPQAVAAIEELHRNYEHHAKAARALAEQYFDSMVVLGEFVDRALRVDQ